ncbi:hypothetical protein AC249_AIPGENE26710 [Exaiptasia diaphana]|nr:hypothetical protein AC249_AIPGENE26710 [Exaiptasia diaphana]
MSFRSEFSALEPSLRIRIKRVCIISGVWASFILGSAAVFYFSKPYLDKRRKEREALLAASKTQDETHK